MTVTPAIVIGLRPLFRTPPNTTSKRSPVDLDITDTPCGAVRHTAQVPASAGLCDLARTLKLSSTAAE